MLDVMGLCDLLELGKEDLNFVWFCKIIKMNFDIVKFDVGCFGNGEGYVEYIGKVFFIEVKNFYGLIMYLFVVNVSFVEIGCWLIVM